ncbi:hypothetical protein DSO57_1007221 [Entomophthora muscae]|uniref:Uncharacterized protein n=1 Tax=Entomophthora muscae TaxID=34485 RepID=A0ACC2TIJ4_9FUNG|nr:hypothetical protein DSO57_1007221 [Entomophthora muscae]
MGLNAYFPQLSLVSSLWSPLQAAIPALHWMTSWWFVSPGWEPNLVSLAPLSHIRPHVFDTTYKPLVTTEEPSVSIVYSTIDGTTASKCDPTFYTKSPSPCLSLLARMLWYLPRAGVS